MLQVDFTLGQADLLDKALRVYANVLATKSLQELPIMQMSCGSFGSPEASRWEIECISVLQRKVQDARHEVKEVNQRQGNVG